MTRVAIKNLWASITLGSGDADRPILVSKKLKPQRILPSAAKSTGRIALFFKTITSK